MNDAHPGPIRPSRLEGVGTDVLADRIRERVYVAFTALAVLLTMNSHAHGLTAGAAAAGLVITTIGTVVAAFVAEVVAHLAIHATLPGRSLMKRIGWVSLGAATTVTLPLLFLAAAALGWWEVPTALVASAAGLVLTLVGVGWLGLRRADMPAVHKLLALVVLAGAGGVVILLKMLAH